jgi:carbon storage regulator
MLILARYTHQSIEIGSDVTVTVLAINGTQVRLGIKAPKHIPVHREEVARRIRAEQSEERRSNAQRGLIRARAGA